MMSKDWKRQQDFAKHLKKTYGATAYFGLHFSGGEASVYFVERKDGTLKIDKGTYTSVSEICASLERMAAEK